MRVCVAILSLVFVSGGLEAATKPFAEKRFDRFLIGSEDGSRYVEGHCEPRADEADMMRCSIKEGVILPPRVRKPLSEADKKQLHENICAPDSTVWSGLKRSWLGPERRAELEAAARFQTS